ncbi:hypothetical protein SAMN02745127_02389 [Oceanospirillum multiglobuliferum]|uniref:Uncharacterized protein n=1 Tax=Oceanospirillum multiglobuliferum TaxID=64969 RepID=A0A1T4RI92_9GAMM|nr:DUF6482 family protein [Oceanospirillum multiglobuliferum]OPX54797.1 hypothetical protein BTE48_12300 [Oceanospirillum multiglobuliferum]SKA15685.1 hypothetical protein SAMN02745127_02389 [Oceanospirillum multiglobuliferum]
MKMHDLVSHSDGSHQPEIHIQSHHEGVYFTVQVMMDEQKHQLQGHNGKPIVFRDEESARNLLQQAGIHQVQSRRVNSCFNSIVHKTFNSNFSTRLA